MSLIIYLITNTNVLSFCSNFMALDVLLSLLQLPSVRAAILPAHSGVATGHLLIGLEAGSFLHYTFKSPIKPSLGPSVPSFGELSIRLHKDGQWGREGDAASWNRICWLGSAPTAGSVFPSYSPLKKLQKESVLVRKCSNSLRGFPHFFIFLYLRVIYLSCTMRYLSSGEG